MHTSKHTQLNEFLQSLHWRAPSKETQYSPDPPKPPRAPCHSQPPTHEAVQLATLSREENDSVFLGVWLLSLSTACVRCKPPAGGSPRSFILIAVVGAIV